MENGNIKGLISHMWLILCYTVQLVSHTDICTKFQNQAISGKCLTEKQFTNKQTQTEKAKTIYPIYFVYRGYNESVLCDLTHNNHRTL